MKNELAGQKAPESKLIDIEALKSNYYTKTPDSGIDKQCVSFGTSGHRGKSSETSFNEMHILAITQAICDHRAEKGITGPLFIGKDTHALSEEAFATAMEVLAANGITVRIDKDGYTPTPAVSHAIREYNKDDPAKKADGIIITPSHNPPQDGGFKYNPPHGGPADTEITGVIADKANVYLKDISEVKRVPFKQAIEAQTTTEHDYMTPYVKQLSEIINIGIIKKKNINIGADALGGAGLKYYERIKKEYDLNMTCMHTKVDYQFSFMHLDHDGEIRMDCSSEDAMAGLIGLKDIYDIAFGNDPDFDRHGIVTPTDGLMNPNHYLAVAIDYLIKTRSEWPADAKIGKTMVSSTMINRVAASHGREVVEVPVGFKWFVPGLSAAIDSEELICFGGEESAGASFRRINGESWTTDKDGIILALLAAEITAVTGKDPSEYYKDLEEQHGRFFYARNDYKTDDETSAKLRDISEDDIGTKSLAGDPITNKLTKAPGNGEPLGGIKVETENGWFAVRPSGTEAKYKIYAESYVSEEHLKQLLKEAEEIVKGL